MVTISFFSYYASGGKGMQWHGKYVIQLGCDDRVVKQKSNFVTWRW
jgi:hypothetical protein